MYACLHGCLPFYCFELDWYDVVQDMIRALEGQLAALQVVDEDDEDDTGGAKDVVGDGDAADDGGDDDGDAEDEDTEE